MQDERSGSQCEGANTLLLLMNPPSPEHAWWRAALCSSERKYSVNRKAKKEYGDHQQSNSHTRSLETLADRNQQQHSCQRHGCAHVAVSFLPASGTLFENR